MPNQTKDPFCDEDEPLHDIEYPKPQYILIVAIVLIFIIMIMLWKNQLIVRDTRGPKKVPYFVPFFGSAFAFWSDTIGFLKKYSEKYKSDIFTAYMFGKPMVFVTDPLAAATIASGRWPELSWSDSKHRLLSFAMQASSDGGNAWAFDFSGNGHALLENHLMKSSNLNEIVLKLQHDLKHEILPALIEKEHIVADLGEQSWLQMGIMTVVGEALYRATAQCLYGYNSFSTHYAFEQSLLFDKNLAIFSALPSGLVQKLIAPDSFKAREEMVEKMRLVYHNFSVDETKGDKTNLTAMADDVHKYYKEKMNPDDLIRYHYLYFAAAFMNTVPAGFWTFFEIMRSKEALDSIMNEIREISKRKKDGATTITTSDANVATSNLFTLEELDQMECLDSVLTETLRLRSTYKMLRTRYATKDFEMKLNLPIRKQICTFNVKKGTYFISIPTLMHRDPEIFNDPLAFQWDRFLKRDGVTPTFSKNGKKILRPVDVFGGGPTICPGRKLARTEIKAMIATLLLKYDVRFPDEQNMPEPPLADLLVNSGMPKNDVIIEIKRKRETM